MMSRSALQTSTPPLVFGLNQAARSKLASASEELSSVEVADSDKGSLNESLRSPVSEIGDLEERHFPTAV